MSPRHGQPGHLCSTLCGAALQPNCIGIVEDHGMVGNAALAAAEQVDPEDLLVSIRRGDLMDLVTAADERIDDLRDYLNDADPTGHARYEAERWLALLEDVANRANKLTELR